MLACGGRRTRVVFGRMKRKTAQETGKNTPIHWLCADSRSSSSTYHWLLLSNLHQSVDLERALWSVAGPRDLTQAKARYLFSVTSQSSSSSSFVLGWGWRRFARMEEDCMEKATGGRFASTRHQKN